MGIESDTRRGKTQRRQLDAFLDSEYVEIVPVTEATTDFYAAIYHELKAKGKPIPTNDMWIAAPAIEHHAVLYSLDGHFQQIPMLRRLQVSRQGRDVQLQFELSLHFQQIPMLRRL